MAEFEVFEALMLLSFSVSWYWSIAKMLQVRAAVGKSVFFVILIVSGYAMGIASKLFLYHETGALSPLIYLYFWNLMITAVDLALVVHFSRSAKVCGQGA